jgi:CBS domain-containing protein
MKVREVMTREVELISPHHTLEQAAQLMAELDAGVLPVSDKDRLVGIITDRDIVVRAVATGEDPMCTQVGDVMTRQVGYCFEEDDVDRAVEIMAGLRVRRLPVLDRHERLVGIVSLADIAARDPRRSGEALHEIIGQQQMDDGAAVETPDSGSGSGPHADKPPRRG